MSDAFVARIDTQVRVPLFQIIDHDRKWLEAALKYIAAPDRDIDPRSFSYEAVSLDSGGTITFKVKAKIMVGLDESTADTIKETLFTGPEDREPVGTQVWKALQGAPTKVIFD